MPELTQPTQEAGTKVQCLQKRKGGTRVSFGHHAATQTTYHFLPIGNDENSPHVAIVNDEEHLAALLAIPEGYRLYRGDNTPVTAIPKPSEEAPAIAFKKTVLMIYCRLILTILTMMKLRNGRSRCLR